MKKLIALALAITPLAAFAQTPAAQDTPSQTADGAQYVQPKDWTANTNGPLIALASPEKDLRIHIVEVGAANDAKDAVAKGWAAAGVTIAPQVRLLSPAPAADGWDERVGVAYETPPSAGLAQSALALRKGAKWTVMIIDGAAATAAKRSAALSVVQQSLRSAGYTQESFAGKTAHRLTPERVKLLRDFVEQSAATLGVPGVGLALIDQGKVVWQGGIGVRALGSAEPVDENTKFMVASNTKGLTTLLLSVLVDEKKLDWDQKVVDLYPSFRLGSDDVTQSVRVRHLVCACTGLPRKDYSFILSDPGAPALETFTGLAATQPTSGFGELFQYNNLMASAAGYLAGALTFPGMEIGAAYDRAMEEKIFTPLGMRSTTFDFAEGMSGNWAAPHGLDIDGKLVRISNDFNFTVYPHRPAGAAFSTTADMVHYVQLELSKGKLANGRQMVSSQNLIERRKRGVQVGPDMWYGMGLFERLAWDVPVVTHGGTLQGFHSNWYALPDAGIGAVILTNSDPGALLLAPFLRRLLEVLYDGKPEAVRDVEAAAVRVKALAAARKARLTYPGDPQILSTLASHYRDPQVGQITISDRDGAKWIKAGYVEGPIATRPNADGSVSILSVGPGNIGVEALVGSKDGKRTLTISDGQQTKYVYVED